MSKQRFILGMLAVGTVFILVGCGTSMSNVATQAASITPQPTVVDPGLASGQPCKPPCWEGLVPGVSTLDDVQKTLERLQDSGRFKVSGCMSDGSQCGGNVWTDLMRGQVEIYLKNGYVELIDEWIGFDYTVEQLFDLVGEPTWVRCPPHNRDEECSCDPTHLRTPVTNTYGAYHAENYTFLVYKEGMAFDVDAYVDLGCVCPYQRLYRFQYFRPISSVSEYSALLERVYSEIAPISDEDYVDWHGFGRGY